MTLYLSVIFVCILILTAGNLLLPSPMASLGLWPVLGLSVLAAVAAIAVDGLFAFLIRRLPAKWFAHDKKIFCASAREKKFYEKLKIRKWKDKIPELGQFTDFHKNHIADPKNNAYLERYMLEAAYGEVIHFVGLFVGFLVIFFFPLRYWYCLGLPVAIANILLNLPSVFILRYNFYKLKILYAANERKALRAAKKEEEQGREATSAVSEKTETGANAVSGQAEAGQTAEETGAPESAGAGIAMQETAISSAEVGAKVGAEIAAVVGAEVGAEIAPREAFPDYGSEDRQNPEPEVVPKEERR